MQTYSQRYKPRDWFEDSTDFDGHIKGAEQVIADMTAMKKLGCKIIDNQKGIINIEVQAEDPLVIVQLKTLGFELE